MLERLRHVARAIAQRLAPEKVVDLVHELLGTLVVRADEEVVLLALSRLRDGQASPTGGLRRCISMTWGYLA